MNVPLVHQHTIPDGLRRSRVPRTGCDLVGRSVEIQSAKVHSRLSADLHRVQPPSVGVELIRTAAQCRQGQSFQRLVLLGLLEQTVVQSLDVYVEVRVVVRLPVTCVARIVGVQRAVGVGQSVSHRQALFVRRTETFAFELVCRAYGEKTRRVRRVRRLG